MAYSSSRDTIDWGSVRDLFDRSDLLRFEGPIELNTRVGTAGALEVAVARPVGVRVRSADPDEALAVEELAWEYKLRCEESRGRQALRACGIPTEVRELRICSRRLSSR